MATGTGRPLTPQQSAVFAAIHHYYEALGEPAPASYVARKLAITKQRVQAYFQTLNDLGWLRSAGSPAIPTKGLPAHGGLTNRQLPARRAGGHSPNVANKQTPRTIELPPLSLRAAVEPQSINDEARTVDLVFTTGSAVERMDWWTGKRYIETLSLEPEHVRLDRLNAGGPLLDSHNSDTVSDQIGAVVPGTVVLTKKEGRARARFSKREDVEPVWQDVKDGIIRSVSVGYRIYKVEETEGQGNKLPIRHAVDWEPFELSMVPIPSDAGASVRGEKPADTNPCEIVTRGASKETPMLNEERSETIVEDPPLDEAAERKTQAAEPTAADLAKRQERERAQGILLGCRAAKLTQEYADKLIAQDVTLSDARGQILAEMEKRGVGDRGPGPAPSGAVVGDDPLVHTRKGIENALLHRVAGDIKKPDGSPAFPLTDQGRKYRGMNLMRIAETFLKARGVRTTEMSPMDLAGEALGLTGRGGMHTTSDFALLLADVAAKTLREAYAEAPQTFAQITRRVTLSDFKPSNRVQIGDAPALLEVKEHGEFTRGTIAEGKEVMQLKTFGRVFAITRQALVNDDTDAFSRVATMFGRSARTLESDLAWAQITSNPVMGDGVVLFHATHANLDAAASAISVTSLGKGRAAMRVQKGIDGVTPLNINPRYLGLPAALETLAATFLTQITPATPANVNPFAGLLTPIVEPRLDVNSATAWYLFAEGFDVLELATLEGEGGPMVESRVGFDIDGLEIKARHDVAAKVIDWRGVWKNPGV